MEDPLMAYREDLLGNQKYFEGIETTCPVCLEEFNDSTNIPRSLHYCSHLVCHRCVQRMLKPPAQRDIGRYNMSIRCPICKQKGRPRFEDSLQQGDRITLALVGAVRHIDYLGKRLKTYTPGLTFMRIEEILKREELPKIDQVIKVSGSLLQAEIKQPNPFEDQEVILDLVRAAEAITEDKQEWTWKFPPREEKPKMEIIINLETGCVRVIKHC